LRVAASSDRVNCDEMSAALSTEPLPFEVTDYREAGRVRVRLRGELDLATAEVVADRLRALAERRDVVLLDLDEVSFIDASGVRVVLAAAAAARNDGWSFAVTHGSAPVRRLFGLLDVGAYVTLDGDRS
jgi:anti-anti-sigma factor